jgi:hypothetical protein
MARQPTLFIVRGHPGSGKTTYGKHILAQHPGTKQIEEDQFFTDSKGNYSFDKARIKEAREWCILAVKKVLCSGSNALVSNDFITRQEMAPFIALGYRTQIVEMGMDFPNTHGLSPKVVQAKKEAFEPHPSAVRIIDMPTEVPATSKYARSFR